MGEVSAAFHQRWLWHRLFLYSQYAVARAPLLHCPAARYFGPKKVDEEELEHYKELEEGEIPQPAPGTPAAKGPSSPLQSATPMMGVADSAQNTDGATQDESPMPMARKRAREDADDAAASGERAPTAADDKTSMGDTTEAWHKGYSLDGYGSNLSTQRADAESDADSLPGA